MTVLGRFTGIVRDELATSSDGGRQLLGGADPGDGLYRASIPRVLASADGAALTTQVMTSVGLFLRAGDRVTNLTFLSGGTAAATPTNWWFALYSSATTPALLQQSADQLTAAWAANTPKTLALATPADIEVDGVYYAAVMVKATTAPTLAGAAPRAAAAGPVVAAGYGEKALAVTSGAALTTTAPATIASPTTVSTVPLAIAT